MEYLEYGRTDLNRIGDPEMITIQELPAVNIEYRGTNREQNGNYTAVVIADDENLTLVFTFDGSENGIHQDTFERFTQSIALFPQSQLAAIQPRMI